jgi:hypothetical protein
MPDGSHDLGSFYRPGSALMRLSSRYDSTAAGSVVISIGEL